LNGIKVWETEGVNLKIAIWIALGMLAVAPILHFGWVLWWAGALQ
jgi:hypothetical protein